MEDVARPDVLMEGWAALRVQGTRAVFPARASGDSRALPCRRVRGVLSVYSEVKCFNPGLRDVLVVWDSARGCAHVFN